MLSSSKGGKDNQIGLKVKKETTPRHTMERFTHKKAHRHGLQVLSLFSVVSAIKMLIDKIKNVNFHFLLAILSNLEFLK